jgi:ADP-ribose pyrophosphatase
VVPVTAAGNLVMVRQYRHNLKRHVLEFPAGVIEAADKDFWAAAERELLEETGYRPAPDCRVRPLGAFYSLPSETNKVTHVFLVQHVEQACEPEGDAVIEQYFDMSVTEVSSADFTAAVGRDIWGMEAVAAMSLARPLVEQWNRDPW